MVSCRNMELFPRRGSIEILPGRPVQSDGGVLLLWVAVGGSIEILSRGSIEILPRRGSVEILLGRPVKRGGGVFLVWVTWPQNVETLRRFVVGSRKVELPAARTDEAVSYWMMGEGVRCPRWEEKGGTRRKPGSRWWGPGAIK